LAGVPVRAIQIEAEPPRVDGTPRWDERHFALARRSVLGLRELGVWPHAEADAHPIRAVRVSSLGDFGSVQVRAADYAVPALGYTVPARVLARAVEAQAQCAINTERCVPARVIAVHADKEGVRAEVDSAGVRRSLRARLLVGADGAQSFVRQAMDIATDEHDYGQTAVVSAVEFEQAHDDCAHERFTVDGPFALLPLAGRRAGLVWSAAPADAAQLAAMDDGAFLSALRERFGARLGRFTRVGRRQLWPLKRISASALTAPRTVLIGNAAQTIHPIGAQGFNLGFRDVEALAALLREAATSGADVGAAALLAAYAARRVPDRAATIALGERLLRTFGATHAFTRLGRSVALGVFDRVAPLKDELAWAMMGYRRSEAA
jgi:2-octaprenyl-6-methoxyphenol hydroxylase